MKILKIKFNAKIKSLGLILKTKLLDYSRTFTLILKDTGREKNFIV